MFHIQYVMTGLSAVALGLVVAHHVPSLPQGGILGFGVPWFFFASGFWMMKEDFDWSGEVCKRVKNLLIPYYLWNVVWFPILFGCNWIGWRYCGANRVVDGSWECVIRCLGLSPWQWPALVPTWFLRALFVVVLVVGGLWHISSKICGNRH